MKLPPIESLKRDFFKWHYDNQQSTSADIAEYWEKATHKALTEIVAEMRTNKTSECCDACRAVLDGHDIALTDIQQKIDTLFDKS